MHMWVRPALALFVVALTAAPAWGHGEVESYEPQAGSRLSDPPQRIVITLTEPPASSASSVRVLVGCRHSVAQAVMVDQDALVASIGRAEPGAWKVKWSAVSSVDGHPTKGTYAFGVRGDATCSKAGGAREPSSGAASSSKDGGSSLPLGLLALASVAIVGIAYVVRRASAS